jgi:hypothetical protein
LCYKLFERKLAFSYQHWSRFPLQVLSRSSFRAFRFYRA